MSAPNSVVEAESSTPLPKSSRVYVGGEIHPEIRVPMRQIELAPTKSFNDTLEENAAVRVYDTSGPWGDPQFHGDVEQGLPPLRQEWILKRGDVAHYQGRHTSEIAKKLAASAALLLSRLAITRSALGIVVGPVVLHEDYISCRHKHIEIIVKLQWIMLDIKLAVKVIA